MKNLLKENEPMYMFKPGCLEYETDYEIEVDGNYLIYKTYPKPKFIKRHEGDPEPDIKEFPKAFMTFMNRLFQGDPIPEPKPITLGSPIPSYGFGPRERRIPDICETISIEAIHVAKGIVRIRKFDDDACDAPWMDVDDLITVEHRKSIDFNKIKPGQIWKLTIDGDPRFQNTLVMILGSYGDRLRFVYQTTVIYATDYQQTDTAEGCIDLYDRSTGNMNNIDIVHLELVTDNTNPDGAIMDRTQSDKFLYPSSFSLGYQEHYPELPPRERKRITDDDYDDDLDE